jgi:urea carboxylase
MVKFKPIDRTAYDQIVAAVAAGRFEPRIRPAIFTLEDFHRDPGGYATKLEEALNGD